MAMSCVSAVKACWGLDMSNIQHFRELPKMHTTYANIIKSLLPPNTKSISKDELPTAIYEVSQLVIDQQNLRDYRKVCGFINDGRVPITYFAVLSQTLQMNMMAKPNFPFAMLGLIHIYNKTTQYRIIFDSEVVQMKVRLDNLRPHDKGQQFDFITEVFADGVLIWEGVSTYLSRQKTKNTPKNNKPSEDIKLSSKDGFSAAIDASEDIGRRYAFVSGDFNLIHIHPLSAKAFGYPRAIAHGMWSKARALSLFKNLPDSYSCEVNFKAPMLLPAHSELVAIPDNKDWQFGVYGAKDKTHLIGHIKSLS